MAYEANAATAQRLIAARGRATGIIRRPSDDSLSTPSTPWKATDLNPAEDPIVAEKLQHVIFDAATMNDSMSVAAEATAIAFVAASHLGSAPLLEDIFETKGQRYVIVQVDDLSPGDLSLLYTLHLKAS